MSPHPCSLLLINRQVLADAHGPGPVPGQGQELSSSKARARFALPSARCTDSAINLCIRPPAVLSWGKGESVNYNES